MADTLNSTSRMPDIIIPLTQDTNTMFQLPSNHVLTAFQQKELSKMLDHLNKELRKSDMIRKLKRLQLYKTIFKTIYGISLVILVICFVTFFLKFYGVIDYERYCIHGNYSGSFCFKYGFRPKGSVTEEVVAILLSSFLAMIATVGNFCWIPTKMSRLLSKTVQPVLDQWTYSRRVQLMAEFKGGYQSFLGIFKRLEPYCGDHFRSKRMLQQGYILVTLNIDTVQHPRLHFLETHL